MSAQDPLRALLPYLPLIIVLIILSRRTQRPRVIRPGLLWIGPAIVLVSIGFYVTGAMRLGPPLHALDWAVIAGTAVIGAALGAVRAHSVQLRRHPDTGAIEAKLSSWGLLIILAWIAGRNLLRQSGWVDTHTPFGLYTDAAMSLALGAVLAQAIVLSRRCQTVLADNRSTSDKLPGSAV
jgi:hypothetical protein